MTTNYSRSMLGILSTQYELICFIVSIKLLFCIYLLDHLIINQLFLRSINTLGFYKIIWQKLINKQRHFIDPKNNLSIIK